VLPPSYDYYAMFHGADERVPLSALDAGVRVMDRSLTTSAAEALSTPRSAETAR
jgi:hypothetical protein